jgi:high-affinity iron transporter
VHAELPASYASVPVPAGIWADPGTLARGKAIWAARCASCHGERGDGRGPAAAALAVKPGDLADAAMVRDMSPRYWFWRVSEGGQVPLFRAAGSAMPAWKAELSVADRWAVIAYAHGFSGVRPRVPAGPRSEPGRRP